MRMRKKKHRDERFSACADLAVDETFLIEGNFNTRVCNSPASIKHLHNMPIHIEIGCGKGDFILGTALKNPRIFFIAVEKNLDALIIAMEKVKKAELSNVRFIYGNADIFKALNCVGKIERIYINFCDPWPKKKQAKRRLTHRDYLIVYKKMLKKGGELFFKTDNRELFEFSLSEFRDFGNSVTYVTYDLHNSDCEDNIMTEYEKHFTNLGYPICYAKCIAD